MLSNIIIKLKGFTLVEVLVAMLILSTSAAGVIASFSYAFAFVQRAGDKMEAMYFNRKATEAFRALWLADSNDPALANTNGFKNITSTNWIADANNPLKSWLPTIRYGTGANDTVNYEQGITVKIKDDLTGWNPNNPTETTKRIEVNVHWGES